MEDLVIVRKKDELEEKKKKKKIDHQKMNLIACAIAARI